jgi:ribosomal protein S18 acetylase RimI-like enzyme
MVLLEELLREANSCVDVLSSFPPSLHSFKSSFTLSSKWASSLTDLERRETFALFESNMKSFYEQSSWGYSPSQKRQEMFHTDARYLLAHHSDSGLLCAFAHFRFDVDDEGDEPLVYLYELQVATDSQGVGLGRRLMQLLELICRSFHLSRIMLTVFLSNEGAIRFYTDALGYSVDDSSPSRAGEVASYEILSKSIAPLRRL